MKKASLFFSFLLAVCALFALVGCDHSSAEGKAPEANETSIVSPFEEEYFSHEWQLYEEAKDDGFTGTFIDFLREINFAVTDDTAAVNYALASAVCVESVFGTGASAPGSLGAGVIYSLDKNSGNAYIITNYHVVYGKNTVGNYGIASTIRVYLYGGYTSSRAISATFYKGEMEQDIAVLSVKGASALKETEKNPVYAAAAKIGGEVSAGERVYAVGNPAGGGFSVTKGVVSVPLETIEVERVDDPKKGMKLEEIRIDAAINHGNSGGGLFNAQGELVGIVNARSESSGEESVGYALPVSNVMNVLSRAGLAGTDSN